jgi:hypothetical protein
VSDPTIHVPGMGDVKRTYVIVGVVLVGGLGIYAYRKRQADASAASSTDTTGEAGTTDTTVDPATGYAEGSPEDLAALESQDTASSIGSIDDSGGGSSGGISTPPATGFASNGAWAQAAETYLVTNGGGDAATIAAALGKYVTGQSLTDAQKSVAEQAIAFNGYPPISDPDGYPPSMRQTPTVVAPVPAVKTPSGVKAISATKTGVLVGWNGQPNARYYMYVNGHKSVILSGTDWEVNSAHAGITIKAGTAYAVNVTAVDQSGKESAKSPTLTVRTAK